MNNPTMLYRCPGRETFEGVACETVIVEDEAVETHLAEGWHRNWVQAATAHAEATKKLAGNEQEQAEILAKLKEAGELKAVHKGRGVWEVQDKDGNVLKAALTKEEAAALAGG